MNPLAKTKYGLREFRDTDAPMFEIEIKAPVQTEESGNGFLVLILIALVVFFALV